ncbi:PRA1 family protein 3-like isoform X2 [Clavelina lepadiformis]|uniref:PRA1 family protein 3-like isoform X2 n=1 Tax=Clavelina lepadiformis TaxID=159417 RepID=UPI004042FDA2
MTSNEVHLPPFRNIDDFILASARFGPPDYQNKERWNNRILQNLLYYQTNYFVVALTAFLLVMYISPLETILGGAIVSGLLVVLFYVSQNRTNVEQFKRDYPFAVIFMVTAISTMVMYTFGSIAVFVFSVALPMLCKSMTISECWFELNSLIYRNVQL